jgi:hypothetical protein
LALAALMALVQLAAMATLMELAAMAGRSLAKYGQRK